MNKKIKKLSIKMEKGGLTYPRPGEIVKQTLTIKNNGQVWWSGYRRLTEEEKANGFCNDNYIFSDLLVRISEYKNVSTKNANDILEKAQKMFENNVDTTFNVFICDATPDEVLIEYEDGEIIKGQLKHYVFTSNELYNLYSYIAEKLLIKDLFFFYDN